MSGNAVAVAPHGADPGSSADEQEGPDFWKLKSFTYNLEDMSISLSDDESLLAGTKTPMAKRATERSRMDRRKQSTGKSLKKDSKKKDEGKKFKKKYSLSKEQYKEYQEIFEMFDTDADGFISVPDLRIALGNIGMSPTKREIFDMIRQGDVKKLGCIDFPGFMELLHSKIMVDMDAELTELFSVFDINSDGVICSDDIANVYAMAGDDIDRAAIDEMIKEADTNNDGVIDFEEFKEILTKNNINKFLKF